MIYVCTYIIFIVLFHIEVYGTYIGKPKPVKEERQGYNTVLVGGTEEGDEVGDNSFWVQFLHNE